MGTNYYVIKRVPAKSKLRSIFNIIIGRWEKVETPTKIHIGKQSGGWKFLWNSNDFKYYETKEDLFRFLKSNKIYSEYGDRLSYQEFINRISIDTGYDCESYNLAHPKEPDFIREYSLFHGYYPNKYGEFYINDLRFTVHTEFG